MAETRTVLRCRWAEPTLFLTSPFWMAAEDYPWSCQADGVPRPIEDTSACRVCARRVAHDPRTMEGRVTFGWH